MQLIATHMMNMSTHTLPIKGMPAKLAGQPYYTLKQLAKLLGISERTIQRWHKKGTAPERTKKNGRLVYLNAAVQQWKAKNVTPVSKVATKTVEEAPKAPTGLSAGPHGETEKLLAIKTKKAAVHVKGMLRRITAAHEAGQKKQVERLTRKYLGSLDARYIATGEAYGDIKPHKRPDRDDLPAIAQKLNSWEGTAEIVTLIMKEKRPDSGSTVPSWISGSRTAPSSSW